MNENLCSNQEMHVLFLSWVLTFKYFKFIRRFMQKVLQTRLIILPMLLLSAKMVRTTMTGWRYDVRKFTVDAILFREIQCKKMDILMFNSVFGANLVRIR